MATHSTFLNPQLNRYLVDHFSTEDDLQRDVLTRAGNADIPAISIAPEQTACLQLLLRAIGAVNVLEIGSLAGYSALTIARSLPAFGRLTCLEINPRYADFVRKVAAEAGLDSIISVVTGSALQALANLPDGEAPLDAVFIDADKQNYRKYFELVYPRIRKGGLIVGDNALAWGNVADRNTQYEPENVNALHDFNVLLATHPGILATLIPLGDGMVVGLKTE